ncbi:MAG: hypothetical protein SGBAC_007022, partial [Bacillariaceae sp.]
FFNANMIVPRRAKTLGLYYRELTSSLKLSLSGYGQSKSLLGDDFDLLMMIDSTTPWQSLVACAVQLYSGQRSTVPPTNTTIFAPKNILTIHISPTNAVALLDFLPMEAFELEDEAGTEALVEEPANQQIWRACCWRMLALLTLILLFAISTLMSALLVVSIFLECTNCFRGDVAVLGLVVLAILINSSASVMLFTVYLQLQRRHEQHQNRASEDQDLDNRNENDLDRLIGNDNDAQPDRDNEQVEEGITSFLSRIRWLSKRLLAFAILQLLLFESLLVLIVPNTSLAPMTPPFAEKAFTGNSSEYAPDNCYMSQLEFQNAQNVFMNNSVFFNYLQSTNSGEGVAVFYLPRESKQIAAYVFDQTIYLPRESCPSTGLLVHELVHIYQFKKGYFNFQRSVAYFRDLNHCFACAYNYGGYDSLQLKMERAIATNDASLVDIMIAFKAEQMARIVEDYYYENYNGGACAQYERPAYCTALDFYALQILDPSRWEALFRSLNTEKG